MFHLDLLELILELGMKTLFSESSEGKLLSLSQVKEG